MVLRLLNFVLLAIGCAAVIVERVADLPGLQYDFIVIGGGTAGNVVANRLTEDSSVSVLVLEAGVSNEGVTDSMIPFYCSHMTPRTPYDWNYTTVAQAGLNGRSLAYPRGHILGGSSSVNFLAYTRGSSEDYDRYSKMVGESSWDWNHLQSYFRKNEKFVISADNHNTTGQYDPSIHALDGINSVSLPGFSQSIDDRVVTAASQLGGEFKYNLDTNSGSHLGIGWTQSTIGNGTRSSSATSYLAPAFINRPNLHVLVHAQVGRVLQTGTTNGIPSFHGVEMTDGVGGPQYVFNATKEIILSAGAIGTPHILLNSGIGDTNSLIAAGIKPLVNLPSVGRNLSDHPFIGNTWLVSGTDTFENAYRNTSLAAEQLQQWQTSKTGPLVSGTFNHAGWVRLPANASILGQYPDPAAGSHTAHSELIITNGLSRPPPPATGHFLGIATVLLTEMSRGSVTVNSSNPFDPPIIDVNFFSHPFDIFAMREAIRSARRFLAAPAWSDYVISSTTNATTDAELDVYIRNGTGTTFHPAGTAGMSAKDASYGVVDPDLRVKKVSGLRIIDASVFPMVPAGHTQAATYVFAERGADLVKQSY